VPELVFGLRSQSALFLGQGATCDPYRTPTGYSSRASRVWHQSLFVTDF
jgi:hypothetical protein